MFNMCNRGCGCNRMDMNRTCMGQIVEPTINKCIEKEFYHEVPHVC